MGSTRRPKAVSSSLFSHVVWSRSVSQMTEAQINCFEAFRVQLSSFYTFIRRSAQCHHPRGEKTRTSMKDSLQIFGFDEKCIVAGERHSNDCYSLLVGS